MIYISDGEMTYHTVISYMGYMTWCQVLRTNQMYLVIGMPPVSLSRLSALASAYSTQSLWPPAIAIGAWAVVNGRSSRLPTSITDKCCFHTFRMR